MLTRLRRLPSMPLAFLILIFVSQVSHAFAGLNLCIGMDGHLDIESRDDGCCPSKASDEKDASLVREDNSCVSCIDISLGDTEANNRAATANPPNQGFFFAPSLTERHLPFRDFFSVQSGRSDSGEPILMAIRTVVLRV